MHLIFPASTLAQDRDVVVASSLPRLTSATLGSPAFSLPTPTGWLRFRVSFLGGIEDPPYLREYFDGLIPPDGAGHGDLPWMLQVIFGTKKSFTHYLESARVSHSQNARM